MAVLNFIQQVLSTPAIFVGLLALLGLALQKKDAQTMVKGTIKTILGFIVLNAVHLWYSRQLFRLVICSSLHLVYRVLFRITKQLLLWD